MDGDFLIEQKYVIKEGYQRYTIDVNGDVCKNCSEVMTVRYYLTAPTRFINDLYKITSKCKCGIKIVLNKTGVVLFVKDKHLFSKSKFKEQPRVLGEVATIKKKVTVREKGFKK